MRKQFGHKWNRRPSEQVCRRCFSTVLVQCLIAQLDDARFPSQITVSFQRDAETIQKYITDAAAANTKIHKEWVSNNVLAWLVGSNSCAG